MPTAVVVDHSLTSNVKTQSIVIFVVAAKSAEVSEKLAGITAAGALGHQSEVGMSRVRLLLVGLLAVVIAGLSAGCGTIPARTPPSWSTHSVAAVTPIWSAG